MLDSIKTLALRRRKFQNPNLSDNGRRTIHMAHNKTAIHALSATLVVASGLFVTHNALGDARSDCIAACKKKPAGQQPACFLGCPPAGAAPTTTQTTPPPQKRFCKSDGKWYLPKDYPGDKVCEPQDPPPVTCDPNKHQKKGDSGCICVDGYAPFPNASTSPLDCKPECKEGEKWDDKGVCKPADKCEAGPCEVAAAGHREDIDGRNKTRHEAMMAAIQTIADNLWLLWLILLVGLTNFGMHVWARVSPPKRKDEEDDGPAKCRKCGGELPDETKFCPACGAPTADEMPDEAPAKAGKGKAPAKTVKGKGAPPTLPKGKPAKQAEPESEADDDEELEEQDEK